MSQPVSRILHPFDIARHPSMEPEVKRAILASWASDRYAVKDRPALRKPPDARDPIPVDEVFAALRALDDKPGSTASAAFLNSAGEGLRGLHP